MISLSGKTALLTGASRGIGVFVAKALAAEGMRLVLSARSEEALEDVAAPLRQRGATVFCCPADLSTVEGVMALAAEAQDIAGPLDVLVNNAGIYEVVPFAACETPDIERTLFLNLSAPLLLARQVLPAMLERGSGHIVNVASIAGLVAAPYQEVYAASKHGIVGFTRSLASTLAAEGSAVRVSSVCPSVVENAGGFADQTSGTDIKPPRLLGAVAPGRVAAAVVRVLQRDQPEAVVCDGPLLPVRLLQNVAPRLTDWVVRQTGSTALFKTVSERSRRP